MYRNIIANGPKPSYPLFSKGLSGYYSLLNEGKIQNSRYLTLIDFTLSSKERRLWVIDLENDSIAPNSLVAHGKRTGEEYAVEFSNKPKSNMSSLGFFITGSTYYGKHGLSLLLEGVEEGINDNARKRAIVIHPASYATHNFVKSTADSVEVLVARRYPLQKAQKLSIPLRADLVCLYIIRIENISLLPDTWFPSEK